MDDSATSPRLWSICPQALSSTGNKVALGPNGTADFYLLQSSCPQPMAIPQAVCWRWICREVYRESAGDGDHRPIIYYVFDILVRENRDLTRLPLSQRRRILGEVVKPNQHVALSAVSDRSAAEMLKFAKTHGVEGLIAKRADSVYQPGRRTGLWSKYRINLGQEFVVGGYIPGHLGVDSVVVGFYRGKNLVYSARVRAGFVPRTRREVFKKIGCLKIAKCPFANLPEAGSLVTMGPGPHGGEDEGVHLGEAGNRRAHRLSGVDRRQSLAPCEIRGAAR